MFGLHLDGQVDVLVRFVGQLLHRRNPHGTDKSAQLLAEERTHILLLFLVKFILLQKADMLGTQLLGDITNGQFVLLGVLVVQLSDLLDELPGMFAFGLHTPILTLGDAAQRRHTHAEEFVQIV